MTSSRSILITGGSRGLGAGLVGAFLERGDLVATCSRSPTPLTEALAENGALTDRFLYHSADLTDASQRKALVTEVVDAHGGIDVLINNSGVARDGVLPLASDADIDDMIALNLRATLGITRLVVRRLLSQRRGGRIINISSVVGLTGYRGLSVYSATKAAVDGLTRSLARELGPRGITVNSVAPGYLRTDMSHGLDESQLAQIARRTPAGRLGEPNDVAAAVQFLASPEAAFINGHVLVVDGGLTA